MRSSRLLLLVLSVFACASAATLQLRADDQHAPTTKPAGPPPMDQAAMISAWQKYATPAAQHAELAKWVGEWDLKVEDLTPGMDPTPSAGTAKVSLIMGGRYLQEEVKATTMGMPFEGLSLTGFDNQRKAYFSLWVDSMSTGFARCEGTMAGGNMDMKGEMTCAIDTRPLSSHTVITVTGDDARVMQMSMKSADGVPMGAMRITYTRKK